MGDKLWKRDERIICRCLGGDRRGPDGEGQTDCVDTPIGVQIKRSGRGSILTRWVEDAKMQAAKEDLNWCLVVRRPNTHFLESTATIRLGFLVQLLQEAGRLPAQTVPQSAPPQSGSAPSVSERYSQKRSDGTVS